jgi:dimeric dUTPase (all-alpha-NTP-PPase superfamily)
MRANSSKDFEQIRKNYIVMAKELCYNDSVIEKLSKAKNDIQLENIMISARRGD